ncbi:MAG: uroporphyrinogen decarboxylase family protein [bacterium]
MNPRDRLLETLKGRRADRAPLVLEGFHYASRAEIDAERDPCKREIAHRIFNHTNSFVECPSFVNRYLVTPPQFIKEVRREERDGKITTTSEIETPKGKLIAVTERNSLSDTVWTIKYPVESMEDIERIRSVPWELPLDLAPPDLSKLPPDFSERGIIQVRISSPFVCVAGMMPYQYFLELCATELNLIKELTAQCLERILNVLDVLLAERSVDYVWMGGCEWLTPPMGSPKLYEELVQDFEREVISRIHEAGAICHIHCHGKVRSTLEMVIERGGDFFEPVEPPPDGDITFAEAKAIAAGRITLGGNVEARVIENEGADAVEEATRRAFEGGKERMVLQTTAGPISKITPPILANYHRMIDVWEELSYL